MDNFGGGGGARYVPHYTTRTYSTCTCWYGSKHVVDTAVIPMYYTVHSRLDSVKLGIRCLLVWWTAMHYYTISLVCPYK